MAAPSWIFQLPGPFVKRRRDKAHPSRLAANADLDVRSDAARARRDIGHPNIFLQTGRRTAAGYTSRFLAGNHHRISVAADAPVKHLESDQLAFDSRRFLPHQPFASEKRTLLEFADRSKPRFKRRRGPVDLMPVETHARFEPQRVPRAQPAGDQSQGLAGVEEITP